MLPAPVASVALSASARCQLLPPRGHLTIAAAPWRGWSFALWLMPLTTNWHLEPCSGVSVTLWEPPMVTWGCKTPARLGLAAACGESAGRHVLRLQEASRGGPYLRKQSFDGTNGQLRRWNNGVNSGMATNQSGSFAIRGGQRSTDSKHCRRRSASSVLEGIDQ